ncbi:MAG: pilus assembly protein N-terminal domain-containing protein [Hyphomicrobiales bacterium]|nr:pilus assembly protein N-terminal domain-containing protein [Hyphomicrobiales bacterium]
MKPQPAHRTRTARRDLRGAKALCLSLGLTLASLAPAIGAPLADEQMLLEVDRALLLRLDQPASAVIIGNPMIADAAIQDQRMLVITGKSFGSTNLIVLDRNGEEIISRILEVKLGAQSVVTMHRGPQRNTYTCSPACEPTLRSGDSKDYFDELRDQITGRLETAAGQAGVR